ncbi:MAG: hypothetical protein QW705_05750 [Zestosphaera sp.]
MDLGSGLSRGSGNRYKVVMSVFEKYHIGCVLPSNCVDEVLERLPEEVSSLLGGLKILKEIYISLGCEPISGVVLRGRTPAGERGTYVEAYRGFLPPLPSFTPAQCVIDEDGVTLGCRYLLQKKYLTSLCEERELLEQLMPEDLNELLRKLTKAVDSNGLWLYVVDCDGTVVTSKVAEDTDL